MELILISNSKLKIMLSAEDMKRYDIECEGEVALRRGFKPVLEMARRDCGFDPDGGRLLVQVFPSRGGGCEMFVTRVGLGAGGKGAASSPTICLLRGASVLASACRILSVRGYGKGSSAYSLGDGLFALILPEFDPNKALPLGAAILEELGERCASDMSTEYIAEHGMPICTENAVTRLADFA